MPRFFLHVEIGIRPGFNKLSLSQEITAIHGALSLVGRAGCGLNYSSRACRCSTKKPHRARARHWMRRKAHWADSAMPASKELVKRASRAAQRVYSGES